MLDQSGVGQRKLPAQHLRELTIILIWRQLLTQDPVHGHLILHQMIDPVAALQRLQQIASLEIHKTRRPELRFRRTSTTEVSCSRFWLSQRSNRVKPRRLPARTGDLRQHRVRPVTLFQHDPARIHIGNLKPMINEPQRLERMQIGDPWGEIRDQ